jgi:hypothetical protein
VKLILPLIFEYSYDEESSHRFSGFLDQGILASSSSGRISTQKAAHLEILFSIVDVRDISVREDTALKYPERRR